MAFNYEERKIENTFIINDKAKTVTGQNLNRIYKYEKDNKNIILQNLIK